MSDILTSNDCGNNFHQNPTLCNSVSVGSKNMPTSSLSVHKRRPAEFMWDIDSIFCGANINNSVFNINIQQNKTLVVYQSKRKRICIQSDDED